MSPWPWLMAAALLVLPVALAFAGDVPDNAVRHESGEGQDDGEKPGGVLLAA